MSDKSNCTPNEPRESQSTGSQSNSAEDYRVGPGSPPPDKRWKKGCRSPNPHGRPRKEQSMAPDVRKAFEQAINKKVPVPRGDKEVLMTRVEIGLEQLLNQFAKGDRHARRDLMEIANKLDIDFLAQHRRTLEEALTPNHQAILDGYVARHSGAANVSPAPRVQAPLELLDDEAAEGEPTPPPPPVAEAKPEPEPPQKPGVNYPKPFNRMTPREKLAWYPELYPEWYAEHERNKQ